MSWTAWLPKPGAHNAAPAEYLYVPCTPLCCHGCPAGTRRWVHAVPVVRRTARWIYYTSDTWDRSGAVVSPGRIGTHEFATGTHRQHPRTARQFFATREAAEAELYRSERECAGPATWKAPSVKELRRAMADAHPDRGGTAQQFIEARRRYEAALQPA